MKERNLYLPIIGITILIILTPLLIRQVAYGGLLLGDDAYYHLRFAEQIKKNLEIPNYDTLADRIYTYNPYHLLLAIAGFLVSIELASKIIPVLLGIGSMTFFYLIMKNLKLEEQKRFFICLILALSPAFIYTFSTSSQFAIIIFLNILGFYFFIKKQTIFTYLAIITFAAIPFFNFFNAIVTLLLLFTYTISTGLDRKKLYIVSAGIILKTIIYHLFIFYRFGLPQEPSFISKALIQNSISDLGAITGFSFFTILLAFIGLLVTWKKRKEFYSIYVIVIALIASSLYFGQYTNIYLNFVIVIIAGYGFFFLMDRKWNIKIIKQASLLLILCGIVFSMVSYITRFSTMQPSSEEVQSLIWLKENSAPGDKILSHYSNGFWIEYFADRPVLLDSYFDYTPNLEQRYADSKTIFNSRLLKTTTEILKNNKIKYIWRNQPMKQGLIWTEKDEGLLFIFSNKDNFKNVYSNEGIEIWEYLG